MKDRLAFSGTSLKLEDEEVHALGRLLRFTEVAQIEDTPAAIQNKIDHDLLVQALDKAEKYSYAYTKKDVFCRQTIALKDSSDMTQYGICHNPLPCDGPHASS